MQKIRANTGMGHAEGRGYWLPRVMGASLRSFTHLLSCGSAVPGVNRGGDAAPTASCILLDYLWMGEGAQRRTHQSAEYGEELLF